MKVYLVGGAVRDALLDYPYQDSDYVVVGETVESMLAQGFRQIGKDFPVFLHPKTQQEYALARTERKVAAGYKGFDVFASPTVTLEEDLMRRDLTINAIAKSEEGLVDPYGGLADLKAKVLRHVSPAFKEDPLRVLRVARFAARFAHLGFTIAPETLALMSEMAAEGELTELVAERVWQETVRALGETSPEVFFSILRDCGALKVVFPEVNALYGVPQPAEHHPEIDTGIHTLMVLEQAAKLSKSPLVRFAALTHDLGKGLTPQQFWPAHHGHETKGLAALKQLTKRLRIPNEFSNLAAKVMEFHTHCHRAFEIKPATMLKLLESLSAFQHPEKLEYFLLACEADSRGRLGYEDAAYPQADFVRNAYQVANAVTAKAFVEQGFTGKEIGEEIRKKRLALIEQLAKE
jgi:tRNA nucleotidyltransferase (CCA-adding enzyme)